MGLPKTLQKYLLIMLFTSVEMLTEATPITWETSNGRSRQFSVISVSENGPSLFAEHREKDVYKKLKQKPSVLLG